METLTFDTIVIGETLLALFLSGSFTLGIVFHYFIGRLK
ncbi:hypothetical protein LCGC14_2569710 [marine sediment metagenome]|uniref:Uncharacterized protein n=1 Tax=marine sediment metagenome TaxID=412755 RepID=A0A0F9DAH5_9ZZZZ